MLNPLQTSLADPPHLGEPLHGRASVRGTVDTGDDHQLLTRTWPTEDAWAFMLLVHGLGEHSGRYEHVGAMLASAGIQTHAYDHRGNGGSTGRRGDVATWSRLHDDLSTMLGIVRTRAGGAPVVLYGHSMGGLIVAGYCLDERLRPDLVVLSAPGLDSTLPRWKIALASLLGRVLPTFPIQNGVDPATLSRDPSVGERLAADRLCATATTARFGAEALREQARVRALASRGLGVPTLVFHGADDGLVPPSASEVFARAPLAERRIYPGLRHELHNEPEGPAVIEDVITWLRGQVRAAP